MQGFRKRKNGDVFESAMKNVRWTKWIALPVCFLLTAFLHSRMNTLSSVDQGDAFVPRPAFARAASFGYDALMSDYYWLQAVQVVGRALHPTDHAEHLGNLIDVVTTVNPWVGHPYRFAAVWLTTNEKTVRQANALLERGIAYHPDDWRMRFYLGFNYFYYLEEDSMASAILETAVPLKGRPNYLPRLVARLRVGDGGLDVAETFLHELIRGTEDPFQQAEYERALDEIQTERIARTLDAAREEYKRRFGKDIEKVEDLTKGPNPVLKKLPPALYGAEWVIYPRSGEIGSSYYYSRYKVRKDFREPVVSKKEETETKEEGQH